MSPRLSTRGVGVRTIRTRHLLNVAACDQFRYAKVGFLFEIGGMPISIRRPLFKNLANVAAGNEEDTEERIQHSAVSHTNAE